MIPMFAMGSVALGGAESDVLSALAGGLYATMGLLYVFSLVAAIFMVVCTWKIYEKAGEPGWASLVPFYGSYVMFKLAWGNGWLFLLTLIPFVNIFVALALYIKLAKAFGKGAGFALGLFFLPIIFMPMLAFGDARYVAPVKL